MSLSTMQDIGGCRAIVFSENQIRKIVAEFENDDKFEIIDFDDYLTNPRDTGYSSYHLIVKPSGFERCIEIQIRTRHQHQWATLVEITDLIYKIKLKEGEDHPQLYNFHKLIGVNRKALSSSEANDLILIDNELKILDNLLNLFKGNYLKSLKNWISASPSDEHAYVIMILNSELHPEFKFFVSFEEAEKEYFNLFSSKEPNMVLIHINKPNFENVGLAYSNYVLSSHPSIRNYLILFKDLILELSTFMYLEDIEFYINYYDDLVQLILKSIQDELNYIDTMQHEAPESYGISIEVVNDWKINLQERLTFISDSNQKFKDKLESNLRGRIIRKKGLFSWLFSD